MEEKATYFQMKVDPKLKLAIQKFAEENFISESSTIRMAVAQFPPIKKTLEQLGSETPGE